MHQPYNNDQVQQASIWALASPCTPWAMPNAMQNCSQMQFLLSLFCSLNLLHGKEIAKGIRYRIITELHYENTFIIKIMFKSHSLRIEMSLLLVTMYDAYGFARRYIVITAARCIELLSRSEMQLDHRSQLEKKNLSILTALQTFSHEARKYALPHDPHSFASTRKLIRIWAKAWWGSRFAWSVVLTCPLIPTLIDNSLLLL